MQVDYKEIGKRVRKGRKENGFAQEELAELVNISAQYLSEVENHRKQISLTVLARISGVLGVTMDELLNGTRRIGDSSYCRDFNMLLEDCSSYETPGYPASLQ